MKPQEPRIIDAYRFPREIRPGCQHQLGCRCDPPYWLRLPSPQELARWYVSHNVPDED